MSSDSEYQIEEKTHPVYSAQAVIMVPPIDFCFNLQTSADNEFQTVLKLSEHEIKTQALQEFYRMVDVLMALHVHVSVMKYPQNRLKTPDAVFPNNWFLTTSTGDLYLFPMASENRRKEERLDLLVILLKSQEFKVSRIHKIEEGISPTAFLEGTGSMVLDHENSIIYAALSKRCDKHLLQIYTDKLGYQDLLFFNTKMQSGAAVYHTNVMMAVGESFAVICDEIIDARYRKSILKSLAKTKEVIKITEKQMTMFCGNLLQLRNHEKSKLIVLSLSAFNAFTQKQKQRLMAHGNLVPIDISTIERVGGGSVRCMMAENFLPFSP